MATPNTSWSSNWQAGAGSSDWARTLRGKTRAMAHIHKAALGLRSSSAVLPFPKRVAVPKARAPIVTRPLPPVIVTTLDQRAAPILPFLAKFSIALVIAAGVLFEAFGRP